ncbi:Zinc finger, RING-type [Dillenia turbinata]|uniref:Zinc finger, RING-type n=1 Tax=Dillenia turbinata TaxID=194707 RepID=A0AAN8VXY0_9MAGN
MELDAIVSTFIDMGSPRIRVRTPAISVNSDHAVRPSISLNLKQFRHIQSLSPTGDVSVVETALISDISACSMLHPSAFSSSLRQRSSVSTFLLQFPLAVQVYIHLASEISDFIDGLMTRMPSEILMKSQVQVEMDIINVDLYGLYERVPFDTAIDAAHEFDDGDQAGGRGLSKSVIQKSLKRLDIKDVEEEGGNCVVCLEGLSKEVSSLPCSHVFHEPCITRWLEGSSSCPICRFQIHDQ